MLLSFIHFQIFLLRSVGLFQKRNKELFITKSMSSGVCTSEALHELNQKKKNVQCWSEEKMEKQSTDNKLHWKGYKSFLSVCLYLIFLHFNTKAAFNFLWNRPYNWNLVQQLRILSGKMPFLSCVARKHSALVKSKCQWSWLILPRLSVIPANCEQRGSVFGTWISRSGQQHFVRMSGSL